MEAVGFVASLVALVETARAIYNSIALLQVNARKRSHLQGKVQEFIVVLESAGSTSDGAADFVRSSLEEVKSLVGALAEPARNRYQGLKRRIMVGREKAKLEELERKLECLRTEVVVVATILRLKKDYLSIYNDRMELPQSSVGLNRAEPILTFLKKSETQELRVVGIHGLPGVGKTTLLNHIWQEASSTAPFGARAHVQIGHDANAQLLCSLQSSILQQLGGGRHEFTSSDSGKHKLKEHFGQLRKDKKPVFLAIDNIFEVEDLQKLLPSDLSAGSLPVSSSIAVTCRDVNIVRALLNICSLNQENDSQVLCFAPPCLKPEESKRVFAACGGLRMDEDAEMLDSLVPLCKGHPLALTVLGKIFAGNAKRERKEWKSIMEQMQVLDEDEAVTLLVTKALRLSYDQLRDSRKLAFLDVVNSFYGWPWEIVERILGESVLKDLKDSSLISVADDWSNCNQSVLREGYDRYYDYMYPMKKVVTMHDLTLLFGEGLRHTPVNVERMIDFPSREGLLQRLESPKLVRNLMLWSTYPGDDSELEFLEKTTSLQALLLLHQHRSSKHILKVDQYTNLDVARSANGKGLRYLHLEGSNSSRHIMEMKLSREVREICLFNCGDVKQLPDTPALQQLERLSIKKCELFEGFSPSCVRNWHKLKDLKVIGSKCITSVPDELGCLENLRFLAIKDCPRLRTLPSIACPLQRLSLRCLQITSLALEATAREHLREISLRNCPLEMLSSEIGNVSLLEKLTIAFCDRLRELPPTIGNVSSLQRLSIVGCEMLSNLPDEVGKLTSLTELNVCNCMKLKALPPAIGNALSLGRLLAEGCESLVELPDEVGKLTLLTELDLGGCRSMKALPAAIGNASSLQRLSVAGCEMLSNLPDEVGKLTSLTELNVCNCKKLKALPPAIGNALSLGRLLANGCESLVELSDEVGKLTLLTELDVGGCKSMKALPAAIGNASSLQRLSLKGWESQLVELPKEMGSLIKLDVSGCKNIKALLLASSLQELSISAGEGLEELLDEVGKLTLLTKLVVDGQCSKKSKALPSTIGNALSLKSLSICGCESLEELPDEVGKLTALTELKVGVCKKLKALPPAIGNALSLETLSISGCESLEELPDEVGKLTALIILVVDGCKKLKVLPSAIGNALSLKALSMEGCESLEELPDEVGMLTSLVYLDVRGCKNLKALPAALANCSSLGLLYVSGCESLKKLPDGLRGFEN